MLQTPNLEEISTNSALAKGLKGKRVGESAILAEGHMQSRTGTIRQILPKYVRRYQDSMAEMQVRFADKSVVESMRIGPAKEDTTKALETILDRSSNASSPSSGFVRCTTSTRCPCIYSVSALIKTHISGWRAWPKKTANMSNARSAHRRSGPRRNLRFKRPHTS